MRKLYFTLLSSLAAFMICGNTAKAVNYVDPTEAGIKLSTDDVTYLYQITDSRSYEAGKSDFYWTLGSHNGYNAIQVTSEKYSGEDSRKQYFYFKQGSDNLHFKMYTADGGNVDYIEGQTGNSWNNGNIGSDATVKYMQYNTQSAGEFQLVATEKGNEYGIAASNGDLLNTRGTGNAGYVNMSWVINTYNNNTTNDNGSRFKFIEVPTIHNYDITIKKPTNGNLVISYQNGEETESIETYLFEEASKVYSIKENTVLSISVNPDFDFQLDKLLPEGMEEKVGMTGDIYYEYTVSGNATIEATFKAIQYGKVSAETSENGSIEIQLLNPMMNKWVTADEFFLEQVEFGTELRAKVEANEGYNIVSVNKNSQKIEADKDDNCYYFTVDAENIIISAEFEKNIYTLTKVVTPEEAGSISVTMDNNEVSEVGYGDIITITTKANKDYILESLEVEGATKTEDSENQYTVTGDVTITATFKKGTSSINEITSNSGLFYNSNDKTIYIKSGKSAMIYDLNGRLVLSVKNQNSINIAELADGVYTVVVENHTLKIRK